MRIAIIGAGACGLYLGWKLATKGHNVTIFEKNDAIGNKVCSGLFSERILDFIPESKDLIENEINYVLINFPRRKIRVNFSKRFLIIDHSKLNNLLYNLAHNAGAEILLNSKLNETPKNFDRVIGCDGADSFIRKELHLPSPTMRIGIQGFVKNNAKENYVQAWPCKNGFLWKVPRNSQIEYGVIANINEGYKIFNDFLKQNSINITNVKARIVPRGFSLPKTGNTTLCGDAMGLTKPWSGGGVVWGLIAADILIKSFPDFQTYAKKMKMFFIPKILISKILVKIVYFLGYYFPYLLPKTNNVESDFIF